MAELLPVPEVAAGATEVLLTEWTVEAGATIAAGDVVAVVETDKAVVEIESDRAATVLRCLATAGTSVDVGAPLALLGTPEEADGDLDAVLAELVGDSVDGAAPSPAETPDPAPSSAETPDPAPPDNHPPGSGGAAPATGRRFVSPLARKMLREAGLDAEGIEGTGPGGRIRRRDVEPVIRAAAERSAAPDAEPAAPADEPRPAPAGAAPDAAGAWTDVPHSRSRRAIARRLTESKQQVPHFYVRRTVRVDALLALRADLNAAAPTRISVNDLLVRAIGVAHQEVPDVNVVWTDDAIRRFDSVDVSVAIASQRGLVTPVLRGVERLSLTGIGAEVRRYVELADAGRLQQGDLEGGSITVSNLGMHDVDEFAAILNPPQAAILAVGAARSQPAVVDGVVAPVTAMNLVLSVDHRAVDGALAATWMAALVAALEQPMRLLV